MFNISPNVSSIDVTPFILRRWHIVCAECGTVWCGFGGVSVCCVWDSLVWVWGSECVLCVGQFGVGLGE